jgi:hypothetical protein
MLPAKIFISKIIFFSMVSTNATVIFLWYELWYFMASPVVSLTSPFGNLNQQFEICDFKFEIM